MIDEAAERDIAEAFEQGGRTAEKMAAALRAAGIPMGRDTALGALYLAALCTKLARAAPATEEMFILAARFAWHTCESTFVVTK